MVANARFWSVIRRLSPAARHDGASGAFNHRARLVTAEKFTKAGIHASPLRDQVAAITGKVDVVTGSWIVSSHLREFAVCNCARCTRQREVALRLALGASRARSRAVIGRIALLVGSPELGVLTAVGIGPAPGEFSDGWIPRWRDRVEHHGFGGTGVDALVTECLAVPAGMRPGSRRSIRSDGSKGSTVCNRDGCAARWSSTNRTTMVLLVCAGLSGKFSGDHRVIRHPNREPLRWAHAFHHPLRHRSEADRYNGGSDRSRGPWRESAGFTDEAFTWDSAVFSRRRPDTPDETRPITTFCEHLYFAPIDSALRGVICGDRRRESLAVVVEPIDGEKILSTEDPMETLVLRERKTEPAALR